MKINEYISEFRTNLNDVIKEVEQKNFTAEFTAESDAVIEQAKSAQAEVEKIDSIIAEIEQGTTNLQAKLIELKKANVALDKKLSSIEDKAVNFGSNVGKFVGATVKRVVTGGLGSF